MIRLFVSAMDKISDLSMAASSILNFIIMHLTNHYNMHCQSINESLSRAKSSGKLLPQWVCSKLAELKAGHSKQIPAPAEL